MDMNFTRRIIVVGEEADFLKSVDGFLSERGICCDSFDDPVRANTAIELSSYVLFVIDMKTNGGFPADFLKTVGARFQGVPVLLITASSCVSVSPEVLGMPVLACLVKPIDFDALFGHVQTAIRNYQTLETIRSTNERLSDLNRQFSELEDLIRTNPRLVSQLSADAFFTLTFQNIMGGMMDIKHLASSLGNPNIAPEACHMMDCPRLMELTNAVRDTVDVLERTRHAFKSKELGGLRKKLESVMQVKPGKK